MKYYQVPTFGTTPHHHRQPDQNRWEQPHVYAGLTARCRRMTTHTARLAPRTDWPRALLHVGHRRRRYGLYFGSGLLGSQTEPLLRECANLLWQWRILVQWRPHPMQSATATYNSLTHTLDLRIQAAWPTKLAKNAVRRMGVVHPWFAKPVGYSRNWHASRRLHFIAG